MRLTNTKINILKWGLPIIFSMVLSMTLMIVFNLHWYNLWYWLISLSLQIAYNNVNDRIVDLLYDLKKRRRLRFKEYVRERKSGEVY